MITIENRFFPLRGLACFLVDGGIILFSTVGSFLILNQIGALPDLNLEEVFFRGSIIVFFCQSCMYVLDMYDLKLSHSPAELFFSIVFAVGFFCIGIGTISYIFPVIGLESRFYYITIVLIIFLLVTWRIAFSFYIYKFAPHKILIFGTGKVAGIVANEINIRNRMGFKLVGFLGPIQESVMEPGTPGLHLGTYSQVEKVVRANKINEVVVALENRRGGYPIHEMLYLRTMGYQIVEWPSFFEKISGRIPIDNLAPSYFIFSQGFRKSPVVQGARRVLSFFVALTGIILLAPVFLVIPLLIRLDSPGRIFYLQERVGIGNRVFRLIKFRSMREDSEKETGPRWAELTDPRITRIGRWIRKYRIDEIPQMINVLKGDIDLVGPRPERPLFVERLEKSIPYYFLRHTVRPGITGWAQVMFPYCGTIEESKEKLQYDLFYVKNMSVKLDLLIILRTFKIIILGRGSR